MAKDQFNPLQPGKLCPFNSNDWETMMKKWNCPDPEFYHCMPNQYNIPGEICVKPNWASKNYCPIFNTAASDIDLIPCDLQYGACSETDYRSNKVYLYPGCLNKTSVSKITSSTVGPPIKVSLPMIIIPVVIVVLLLTIGIIWFIKRNKKKGTNKSILCGEMQPLLDIKTFPVEFFRTINYLNADVFVITETYTKAIGMLETRGWITLTGPPGSGKTMTAIQLAKRKLGCSGSTQGRKCTFHFCKTLDEIPGLSNDKSEPYVILDDFFEQYRYYPSKLSVDKASFDNIFREFVDKGPVHVIFTIKEDTWNFLCKDALFLDIFKSYTPLNMKEKPLTTKEKESMLRNHLRINHIEITTSKKEERLKQDIETFINQDGVTELNSRTAITIHKDRIQKMSHDLKEDFTFFVPVIIDLMCVNRYMLRKYDYVMSKTFRKTLKMHVENWIKSEKDEDKKSFCVVLFAGLCSGVVSIDDFHSDTKGKIYVNVCKKYKAESCDRAEIEYFMKRNVRVRGFLYSVSDSSQTYVFHHESLLDFFLVYACSDEAFLIENANIDYILQRCKLSDKNIADFFAEKLGNTIESVELNATDKLVDRIRAEIRQGHDIPLWDCHIFRKHETFNNKWNKAPCVSKCDKPNTAEDAVAEENGEKK
ncbi:uncharacterized protein LOC134240147 [Saccostrea cucullata]|uniref:uncharacterized protein LOC134240147 n=1 Tax=Saccostrea cuccullata TaxID=36930 RepID=UPI002ED12457